MKKLLEFIVPFLLACALTLGSVGCGIKMSDIFKPPGNVPDRCKESYVYTLGVYPNITSAIEAASVIILASVKDSAEPMIIACQEAKKFIQMGSLKAAFVDLASIFTKNSKYAPAAMFAILQVQDRFQDIVLTECDKEVLCGMFERISVYATAAINDSKK